MIFCRFESVSTCSEALRDLPGDTEDETALKDDDLICSSEYTRCGRQGGLSNEAEENVLLHLILGGSALSRFRPWSMVVAYVAAQRLTASYLSQWHMKRYTCP